MKDEKNAGFFNKLFKQKSPCCSMNIEEIDPNEDNSSEPKDIKPSCCSLNQKAGLKKEKKDKE